MKKSLFPKTSLMFVSPWLSAAAIGLLTLIIVIFAANNIRREKGLMVDTLLRKGQSLVQFVEAGMRASVMTGMMVMRQNEPWEAQTQRLIEQASEDPEIHYIAIIDTDGLIMAHSDPTLVGERVTQDMGSLQESDGKGSYHIITQPAGPGKVFEVVSVLEPFQHSGGNFQRMWQQRFPGTTIDDNKFSSIFGQGLKSLAGQSYILVGLDMTDLEDAVRQYRFQIIFMSLALLLVGLGGWISLMAAQGYRVSQDTLNRVQAFTGLLISRLPVGVIATDQEGRIKTFNQAAAEMTGKQETDVVNQQPTDILPASFAYFFDQTSTPDGHNTGKVMEREISLEKKGKPPLALHLSSVPVSNQQGEYMGQVLLMYDLSELKKLEKEVQRHDRLVALGKMAAGVAHEVRNPLSSIKGFATLLGAKFSKGSKEYEAADLLVHEADRLNRSITELLNYARPTPLKKVRVDITETLRNSQRLISADAEALGVDVTLEVAPGLSVINIDPDRLNQVLLNLYLNSLQAMQRGDRLSVRAVPGQQNGTIDIIVRDTGCGIPEELLDRVLDPYFTTKPDGTGLGLAMAYKITDEHGGTMSFVSKTDQGTEVTVTLPVN